MLVTLLRRALRTDKSADRLVAAGQEAYRAKRYRDALEFYEKAIAADPASAACRHHAAAAEYALGNARAAWRRCEEALERNVNFGPAHALMAQIELPGPPYTAVLAGIHRALAPRTYVEIGVFRGESLALTQPATRAIGIDPQPKIESEPPPNITVYTMTSDDYFARRDVRADLGGRTIDLAFIDGLHHFDVALRDFINVERHCTPESTVLVHDWCPLNRRTAERDPPFQGAFYSGDVWRLALVLKKYRPDLAVATVATAPTGLGVVRHLDPTSTVLEERYDAIVAEFMALDYGVLDGDKRAMLNVVPNDWTTVAALIGAPAAAA